MDAAELEVALEELETRLERLRALYEQYFMGIERIEPAIPRKDVDRRIYVLRREKIRNTAKRFKLQTIIQRYNTFQQYWQRICREIENGTYKRHVLRVERASADTLLTIAARKRLGRLRSSSRPPPAGDETAPTAASSLPPSAPLAAAGQANVPRTPPPQTPAPKPALESLSLDMDFLGDWDPGAQAQKSSRPKHLAAASPAASVPMATAAAGPPAKAGLKPPPKPTRAAQLSPAVPPPPPPAAAAPPPKPAAPPKPVASPAPASPAPAKPTPKPAPVSGAKTIAEDQVRSLHARLLEAKRQTKDASSVSVEGLARSLEATAAKLREQHKNRKIEFDVVIKDGKAVVKPIVR